MRSNPLRVALSSPVALAAVTVFVATLCVLACNSGAPTAIRLEERLKGIVDSGRPKASPDEIEDALTRQLRTAPVPAQGSNRPSSPAFPTRETLREFYSDRGGRLAWCDEAGRVLPSALTFLDALKRAGEHGLNPEDYALSRLEKMKEGMQEPKKDETQVARWADFDLLLTTAFFRYASDLSTGRVHPDEIRSEWHTEPPELNLPKALSQALEERRIETLLESLPPPHAGYKALREALADLRRIEQAGGWQAIPVGPTMQKGSRGARVDLLRQRLSGSPGGSSPVARASTAAVFDASLAERVAGFQKLHGIEPDGVVSEATLSELNVPVARRIRQVELNLERWRWIPRRLGEPYLEVNIPGFNLALIRDGGTELRSRIVVGKAFTPTPVFSDRVVAIVANPPWNVPDDLAVREYVPELRKNPDGLREQNIRVFEGTDKDAREVDPSSVDWDDVDEDDFKYHLRQDPGPDNALGNVKFQLTNDFQIYLHDTPARSLFARADRDLSHGCIRVEKARELADRLLGDASVELAKALESENETAIAVRPPVPIQILYLTAWVDEEGGLSFGPDIYEFDPGQQAALDRFSRTAQR
ncbi:MAG TPA: L,D-transpeptidase family protein [Candidatus Polarisedimenticolia bacterium]|nr:L,D-transpeptidase family protein [Candidatus Polarisedimenticolia bacterium]